MDLANLRFLCTSRGKRLLAELSETTITDDNHLALATQLRHELSAPNTHAVLETALLRQRAARKFSRASMMFFTRPALEQASAELVSDYRARRYARAGVRRIVDMCCGVGGDSLSLAAVGQVLGLDRDILRLTMARENANAYGRGDNFQPVAADLLEFTPPRADALFFDPGRRDERGRRLYSVHDYLPPLSLLDTWRARVPHAAAKISPAVAYEELSEHEAEVEFISVAGELREAVLWHGDLRTVAGRRATLLPGEHTLAGDDATAKPVPVEPISGKGYLYEPDSAVIRAHLVQTLARRLEATRIDQEIAYLVADKAHPTPFARCFHITDSMPFQLKRLRRYLRSHGIGNVTVKKRGSPLEPATLTKQLRLEGEDHALLFLTRVQGEPYVLIGEPWSGSLENRDEGRRPAPTT